MAKREPRIDLRSAFAGGLVAALLVTAAPAIADVGDALLAGKFNTVDKKTAISGTVPGDSMLKVANGASDGSGITIQVGAGNAPLVVDSAKRVKRLNADKLDGRDAADFAMAGDLPVTAAGQIRENGTIRSSVGAISAATNPTTGVYCIEFASPVSSDQLESAVVGQAGTSAVAAFPRVTNGEGDATPCSADALRVEINDSTGTLVNARFSVILP